MTGDLSKHEMLVLLIQELDTQGIRHSEGAQRETLVSVSGIIDGMRIRVIVVQHHYCAKGTPRHHGPNKYCIERATPGKHGLWRNRYVGQSKKRGPRGDAWRCVEVMIEVARIRKGLS